MAAGSPLADGDRLPRPEPAPTTGFDVYLHILEAVPEVGSGPEALDPYTSAVRGVYAAYLLDGEINNGGFSQLFFNGLGVWLDEAIGGLAAAGLGDHRQVLVDAADHGVTLLQELRAAQTGASLESYAQWADASGFGPFDDRWYALPSIDIGFDDFVETQAGDLWSAGS